MQFLLKLSQYIITIYYLKFSQIFWRIYYFIRPRFLTKIKSEIKIKSLIIKTRFLKKPNSLIEKNKFKFLNETHVVSDALTIKKSNSKKLWLYNLNYFDFLNSKLNKRKRILALDFLERWLFHSNSPQYLGYDPYPTSLRIVNWIKFYLNSNIMDKKIKLSLYNQTEFLYHNLEWHLLGNHILANAKALIFSGLFFTGPDANKWKNKGIKIYKCQLKEQILDDGGHFEKSPMYHAIILEDILDIINIHGEDQNYLPPAFINQLVVTAEKMLLWLSIMSYTNGENPHFNDSTINISNSIKKITKYAKTIGIRIPSPLKLNKKINIQTLKSSGFIRVDQKHARTFLDIGSIGASYIPGHAHADTMCFETSFFGDRFFVNLGISTYEYSTRRLLERSTSSHNTVEINNKNSSSIWSSFRVAQRASVFNLKTKNISKSKFEVSCFHNGYNSILKKNYHFRKWIFEPQKIIIIDRTTIPNIPAIANFNLYPGIKIFKKNNNNYILRKNNKTVNFSVKQGQVKIVNKLYAVEFGNLQKTKCISIILQKEKSEVTLSW